MNKAMVAVIITLQFSSLSSALAETLSLSQLPQRAPVPIKELEAVKKAVDPEKKMTEAQRSMFALGQIYQYQINKGNSELVARIALQLLQLYRLETIRYSSIVAYATENGDIATAGLDALKAYVNAPNSKDIAVFKDEDGKLNYSFTDATTGKTIVKGVLSPSQLASQATGIASAVFEKLIYESASLPLSQSEKISQRNVFNQRRSIANGGFSDREDFGNLFPTAPLRSPPSFNCVTMNEVYGSGSTTHCDSQ